MPKYRILIVDDQHEVRRVLRSGIETLGSDYHVMDMPSAEEAQLVIFRYNVDLLVTDVRLPGISGLELMEKIKKRNPDLKVILITGISDQRVKQEVASSGASAFFIKPLEMADFLDTVERLLGASPTSLPAQPILPTQPILDEPEQPAMSLSKRLACLRQDTRAVTATLVDEDGKVLARDGSLPESLAEDTLIPALMAVFDAGSKIAHSLEASEPESISCFTGPSYHLTLAPVGWSASLLLIHNKMDGYAAYISPYIEPAVRGLRLALADFSAPANVEVERVTTLQAGAEPASPEQEDIPDVEITEEDLRNVDALFEKGKQKDIKTDELDSFWENLAEESAQLARRDAGALSYEEAHKLGIAPEDDEGES